MNADTQFEGWAILEIFGHQKYAGYVKTEYYGTACMFRCDVPPLPERERVTRSGCYVKGGEFDREYAPAGSTVKESATPGYSKLFGVGAIYSMTPCDEAAARRAVEELQPRALMLVSLPAEKALGVGAAPEDLPPIFDIGVDYCADCHMPLDVCSCSEEDSR
jgi:hypothetical protein